MSKPGPDTRWFKPKDVGYGFTPASWRGWAATAVFVVLFTLAAVVLSHDYGMLTALQAMAVILAAFLVVGHWTGARDWWKKKAD
jgi:hypothetical protein